VVPVLALGLPARVQVRRQEPSRGVVLGLIRLKEHAPQFSLVSYSAQICLVLHSDRVSQH
jgi:hypothetical protein